MKVAGRSTNRLLWFLCVVLSAALAAGCGGGGLEDGRLRLGYFANVTHTVPILGITEGVFARHLTGLQVQERLFLAGPEAISSILAGSVDAAYLGPGPAITGASRAPGQFRIVAGANDAGAILIARPGAGILGPGDLAGRRVAIPTFGGTQDLALRHELREVGLAAEDEGGDVRLIAIRNADLGNAFANGVVDAAIPPEPWGSVLLAADEAELVLDADQILDGGRYPTTVLVVSARLARERPEVVRQLIAANAEAVRLAAADPALAGRRFLETLEEAGGRAPPADALAAALRRVRPTTRIAPRGIELLIEAADRAGYLDGAVRPEDVLAPSARQGIRARG